LFTTILPPSFTGAIDSSSRASLRKKLRTDRLALSVQQQQNAANSLAVNLLSHSDLYRARNIGIYLPNDGEIDPSVYVSLARQRGIKFYLPVLHPIHQGKMVFSPFNDDTPLAPNRFGIPEPAFRHGLRRPPWSLDAVLFPLVGFDETGGRLGMGGGFYDRTFAFTLFRSRPAPKLIGLAHECQKVRELPTESWDVPLHSIVTDERRYHAKR
jgi:5-formyltetrahydrofolate cyclo-ligase